MAKQTERSERVKKIVKKILIYIVVIFLVATCGPILLLSVF
jgi:hypothetical protein